MKKSTSKKALIASAAAVSLSALLFAGTTYAWFTDSASSAASVIKSGNLDVGFQVYDANEEAWVDVTKDTNLLAVSTTNETGLWEPGHVETVQLKVTNKGSLALKYSLAINTPLETAGKDADGNDIWISQYLKYALVKGSESADVSTREKAEAVFENSANVYDLSDYSAEEVLYPAGLDGLASEEFITLVIFMPSSVGNEANFASGEAAPTLQISANLNATQTEYESDSFDKNYDSQAWVALTAVKNSDGTYSYEDKTYVKDGDSFVEVVSKGEGSDLLLAVDGDGIYTSYQNSVVSLTADPDTEGYYTSEDGTQFVSGVSALLKAISNGGVVVLIEDVTADEGIIIS
jgi:predicted ribosomally synthesized peptide with SipW-like signal peptide